MNKQEWQPIETAPKDGRCILGRCKGKEAVKIYWATIRWECWDDKGWILPADEWMPLPEPPK